MLQIRDVALECRADSAGDAINDVLVETGRFNPLPAIELVTIERDELWVEMSAVEEEK